MRRSLPAPAALGLAALALFAIPGAALAQPRLVAATPAANATVSRPTVLRLTFSETLAAPLSGVDLVMTGMPGMASHAPMPIRGFTTATAGPVLTVTLPRPLPAGSYQLKWHAAAADQQRVEGSYAFTVR
ncbi:copper resistance protein CopC [Novosphingobium bradum]|uniref:Copper resistance protein CopC n=1 Tax=Novosphingobium bradum TaxID=1737444 RepID=A0ABV7IRV7_9SPHN